jgi:hypothetical protein
VTKLRTDVTTKQDLLEYLSGYSDFSFELSVLKMLLEHDIGCEHGGHYVDPVTNKSREFDIRATKTIEKYRVRMAIECKNIRDNFPILVSCVPRREEESYHQVALARDPSADVRPFNPLLPRSRAKVLDIRGENSLYVTGDPVGKSTAQVGRSMDGSITSNDNELYEKWGQCLNSLHDMAKSIYWDGDEDDHLDAYISSALPFVVVPDGRLWMAVYDLDGRCVSEPTQVDRCSCFIGKDYNMRPDRSGACIWISHLEITTYKGLRAFVESHLVSHEGMQKVFPLDGLAAAFKHAST